MCLALRRSSALFAALLVLGGRAGGAVAEEASHGEAVEAAAKEAAGAGESVRALIHVLSYLSRDYPRAVRDGKVESPFEYQEQQDFAAEAVRLAARIPELGGTTGALPVEISRLAGLIAAKAPAEEVTALARDLAGKAIAATGIAQAPLRWPDLKRGGEIFAASCAVCHGARGRGDGPGGAQLNPPPADLRDPSRMESASPFSIFNTIRLGVQGTGMVGNANFPDEDAWDLAFYAASLRHEPPGAAPEVSQKDLKIPNELLSLEARATLSDAQLRERLAAASAPPEKALAFLRTHVNPPERRDLLFAREKLGRIGRLLQEQNTEEAGRLAISAYLDDIEPVEPLLRARSAPLIEEIEACMGELRGAIRSDAIRAREVAERCGQILSRAELQLSEREISPAVAFTSAAIVLLREGLEAALLIAVLLGVLSVWKRPALKRAVHAGWVLALAAGLVVWLLSGTLLKLSGAGREALEGATGLLAVAVLLYVGFWLHRAGGTKEWQRFVDEQARKSAESGRGWGLFLLAFFAVFREAFETVLFYRTLWIEAGPAASWSIAGGAAAGAAAVAALCIALFLYERRLPLQQVFGVSAVILGVLAVVLTGKFVHSFQESGALPIHFIARMFRLELLGVFPTAEGLLAQAAVLVLVVVLFRWGRGTQGGAGERASEPAAGRNG